MNLDLANYFIASLTGNQNTICDFRVLSDTRKDEKGINIRGTISEKAAELEQYNNKGYGIFVTVNSFKADCRKTLENIEYIRAHVIDLDDPLTAQDSYKRATESELPPHLAVQSSLGKYHMYWFVEPYAGNEFYKAQQTKLVQMFGGDPHVVDATRVLRVPGFNHNKTTPQLVTCWSVHQGARYNYTQIADFLKDVGTNKPNFAGSRSSLGNPKLAAPSLEWLKFALHELDPNNMTRDEWMPIAAAFKQAGWTLASEQELYQIFSEWCAKYEKNDEYENKKLWDSIEDTQVGWARFLRLTNVQAYINGAGTVNMQAPKKEEPDRETSEEELPEILDAYGKKIWFKDCFFVESEGKIFTSKGRFMNNTQFNGSFGGKEFCLKNSGGKVTRSAWEAATLSTDWTIPKVDHCRFLPTKKPFEIVTDELGRKGLNVYIPSKIKSECGDTTKWLDYLRRIFKNEEDIRIFESYLAHCIKYAGYKIPWAVLLQSAQGIGKQMIGDVIKRCIGEMYVYQPKAEELVSGVSRFNGWMANKLAIIVDEVRVGDRYDLMNGLKTIITDKRIAVEKKGVDQEMTDNVANWFFFSNFKDAFPIDENERRYCIFYSRLQSAKDIADAGLNKHFFDDMYLWLEKEGYKTIAYRYLNYPVERGSLPHRAPETSSYAEVLKIGRSPLRVLIDNCVEKGDRGFRGGYINIEELKKACNESLEIKNKPSVQTLKMILEQKGYVELNSELYGIKGLSPDSYEKSQLE